MDNTYDKYLIENEFEQSSENFGYDSKREQYRREFNQYLEEWNMD